MSDFNLIYSKQRGIREQPYTKEVRHWIKSSLLQNYAQVSIECLVIDLQNSQRLNFQLRAQDKPTDVISIEYADTRNEFNFLYGEIYLCHEIIAQEAKALNKNLFEHYALMIVHGVLHIQGLDHQTENEAEHMEFIESKILHSFGMKR